MSYEFDCAICMEEINKNNNYAVTPCGHKFCFNCILQSIQTLNTCPYCREVLITESDSDNENIRYIDKIFNFLRRIMNEGFTNKELFYIISLLLINNYFYLISLNSKINYFNVVHDIYNIHNVCYLDDFSYNNTPL